MASGDFRGGAAPEEKWAGPRRPLGPRASRELLQPGCHKLLDRAGPPATSPDGLLVQGPLRTVQPEEWQLQACPHRRSERTSDVGVGARRASPRPRGTAAGVRGAALCGDRWNWAEGAGGAEHLHHRWALTAAPKAPGHKGLMLEPWARSSSRSPFQVEDRPGVGPGGLCSFVLVVSVGPRPES